MEQRLRGRPGAARVEVTARGRLVRELQTLPDVAGPPLQHDDRRRPAELRRAPARRGIGLAAWSSTARPATSSAWPRCRPTIPTASPTGSAIANGRCCAQDERQPLLNKALNALYPPGSTFKPAVAMALLEAGVDPEETVSCGGGYQLGNRVFRCLGRHGPMNMHTRDRAGAATPISTRWAGGSASTRIAPMAQRARPRPALRAAGRQPELRHHPRPRLEAAPLPTRNGRQSDTLNAAIGQGYVHPQSAAARGHGGAHRLGPRRSSRG